jgi:hypothetical protein
MNYSSSVRLLVAVGLLSQASCSDSLTAPRTSEILPVSVQTRSPVAGEVVPSVRVSGGMGYVSVSVTTTGTCATMVSAGVSRRSDELTVVAHVGPNPAAVCAAVLQFLVADYHGTITAVAPGNYRVRVFEGFADNAPKLIGSATVSVAEPFGQL